MNSADLSVRWGVIADAAIATDIVVSGMKNANTSTRDSDGLTVALRQAAMKRELILGYDRDYAEACMVLSSREEVFWPYDRSGDALYIHNLAVRPEGVHKGWTERLVTWARVRALQKCVQYLKVTTSSQGKMVDLFLDEGFELVDFVPRPFAGGSALRMQMRLRRPPAIKDRA